MNAGLIAWVGFALGIAVLLGIDLLVVNRGEKEISVRAALWWSAFWVGLAFAFAAFVWLWLGAGQAKEFIAAYLIEKSLSVDNIFVFLLIFATFRIQASHQHKVLFWGIFGAIIFRLLFILGGLALLETFSWTMYAFGALLVYTAIRMWRSDEPSIDPEKNPIVRFAERRLAFDPRYTGHAFWFRRNRRLLFTPLVLALLAIESADLVFAVDSVPAVLAISRDPFIAYTSNVFAILGLRSLYFALAGCLNRFRYLHYGLAVILGFVGIKMLISEWYHVPIAAALGVIAASLIASITVSIVKERGEACQVAPSFVPAPDPEVPPNRVLANPTAEPSSAPQGEISHE